MRKKVEQDERILAEKRKIGSDACQLLMLFLIGAIIVKQYVFQAAFQAYAVEFIGFFGISLYILIRNMMMGHQLVKMDNKRLFKSSLVNGGTIAFVIFVLQGAYFAKADEKFLAGLMSIGIAFICGVGISFLANWGIRNISQKRLACLEKDLECEED